LLEKIRFKTDIKGLNIIIESKWKGKTEYIVSKDGKLGIIDDIGEQLVPIGKDEIQDRLDNCGVYPLRKANKWGIYTNGLYVEPSTKNCLSVRTAASKRFLTIVGAGLIQTVNIYPRDQVRTHSKKHYQASFAI